MTELDFEHAIRRFDTSAVEVTFDDYARRWEAIVGDVEGGYTMTIYDYTNDLDARSVTERALELLAPDVRASYTRRLGPLDERFRASTRDIGRQLLPWEPPLDWWQSRVPLLLVEELLGDLRSRGIETEGARDSGPAGAG